MGVFKEQQEIKRVIFNIRLELAERLEKSKKEAKQIGKKLDVDGAVNRALEKFLRQAEKRIREEKRKHSSKGKDNGGKTEPAMI